MVSVAADVCRETASCHSHCMPVQVRTNKGKGRSDTVIEKETVTEREKPIEGGTLRRVCGEREGGAKVGGLEREGQWTSRLGMMDVHIQIQ